MKTLEFEEIKYKPKDKKVFEVGINGRTIYFIGVTYCEIEDRCKTEFGCMPYFMSIKGKLHE